MKRFSRFITEKRMTHVIDRNTGKSVYGPTDVADAKRYLKKQIQPNKFMIKDIKESVELEDGKQVTVKQFVSDEAAQSAIEDAEGLLDSTEVMSGVFAMVFDSKVSKDNFVATHKDSLKEEVQLDEGRMQNTVKKMNNKQKAILAKQLNKMDLSGYGDYMADVRNVHKFKDKDLERALNKVLPSVAAMALKEAPNPEFLKVYDSLKKGDRVEVEFDSGIRKGNKITLVVTSGHRVVGKARVGRIIMKSPDNMRGVSYTLYNRNGSVSLALGDMATVMKSIKKK